MTEKMKDNSNNNLDILMRDLRERRKELDCLYQLEELLKSTDKSQDDLFRSIIDIIPPGWQFSESAQVKIEYGEKIYTSIEFVETAWKQSALIKEQNETIGKVTVSYRNEVPLSEDGLFLKEEEQLIETIADRIGHMLLHKKLKNVYRQWKDAEEKLSVKAVSEWRVIVNLLQNSNPKLFNYLSQKMLHYLCWNGVTEAKQLLQHAGDPSNSQEILNLSDTNQPSRKESMDDILSINNKVFRIAEKNLGEKQLLENIRRWIDEDKSRFLIKALEAQNSSVSDLINAITRFHYLENEGVKLSLPLEKSLRVSLIRHFFSDQLGFINIAKNYIKIKDYRDLVKKIIFPSGSHGKLGGKSAGLFLANCIINASDEDKKLFETIKTPKTWYVTSDGLINFLHYNNLESVFEQKYKELDEIHVEYKNIIQIFKNSHFPPEIVQGLSTAIDDFGDNPIIVRSSSLLEDRLGAAFSGKYKSLFLANQGTKEKRLEALTDAIAEVYASTFGPDPIEYRSERELLDFYEEMGIMIQEVVGTKVGKYFFPTSAGVALSNNEFRWSPRINREDGLIRIVPGLGTRAVDRVAEDYPVLIAPGKPNLRANVTTDEIIRYAPKNIDVINLEENIFETVDINILIKKYGKDIPGVHNIVSIANDTMMQKVTSIFNIDFDEDSLFVTFDGLLHNTDFVKKIFRMLKLLEEKMGTPVDIEFAHDGKNLYLLQCRPQSYSHNIQPAPIPKNIPEEKIAFSANQYISNGFVPDITHIVYVDPESYGKLSSLSDLKAVGRAVGKLNKILPKRQFILMGPGRWGSRGDIKLGVDVTYSDINNTAVLIEIAKKKGKYLPELSFGTHFFQDLVEASIRYLPLYPDDDDTVFNEEFFARSTNILGDLIPEYSYLADTVRVIDVPENMEGAILRVLMNSNLDEAVAIFSDPEIRISETDESSEPFSRGSTEFWSWRNRMVENIAMHLDAERFGVKGFYLFGSVKNATCGPASDIDILIHFYGTKAQKKELLIWLEGWSLSLAYINFQRTGYKTEGLLDIHFVTDEDIKNKTSYAVKIGAVTDAAHLLPMKNGLDNNGN